MDGQFGRQSIALLVSSILMLAVVPAAADIFAGLPDAIVCTVEELTENPRRGRIVFYLDAQVEGGETQYKTLGAGPLILRIDQEGNVAPGALPDCNGKSIKELRDAGRAFDFK
jgi:hypothetical protein